MKHIVRFEVSKEVIAQMMALPDDATIQTIRQTNRIDVFEFTVEQPDLPEVAEGQPIPLVSPLLTIDHERRPAQWITFDFNLASAHE